MGADRTRRTPKKAADWAPRFIEALYETGMVAAACDVARIGRTTAYDRRQRDEGFADAWDQVIERTTDELEAEAVRRAKDGSDTLLIFLLKSRREQYAERREVTHTGSVPVNVNVELDDKQRQALSDVLRGRPASSGE